VLTPIIDKKAPLLVELKKGFARKAVQIPIFFKKKDEKWIYELWN